MPTVLLLLLLLCLVALLVGLIKPGLVVRWGEKRTRGKALLFYGIGAALFFVLFGVAANNEAKQQKAASAPGAAQAVVSAPKPAPTTSTLPHENLKPGDSFALKEPVNLMPELKPVDIEKALAQVVKLPVGTEVKVLNVAQKTGAPWYQVKAGQRTGWINSIALMKQFAKVSDSAPARPDPMSSAPPRQKGLAEIVTRNLKAYEAADNELKKSAVRHARREEIHKLIATDGIFKGWVGRLEQMGTTGDGNAYVVIDCGPFSLMTSNNEFSAKTHEVNTLIPAGSPLFNEVAQLSKGDYVICTGSFIRSKLDYIELVSLTEGGAMDDPDFHALFKSIKPWSEVDRKKP